jgi:hypothetical protein
MSETKQASPDAVAGQVDRGVRPQGTRLPDPFDWCYEWDGPYGTRKFSPNQYNGRQCDRTVALFKEPQMHAYAEACVVAATAECSEHWQTKLDAAVAAERERFIEALADACLAAEIPDSKYESLLIALRA